MLGCRAGEPELVGCRDPPELREAAGGPGMRPQLDWSTSGAGGLRLANEHGEVSVRRVADGELKGTACTVVPQ